MKTIIFDLETIGIDTQNDRIIQLGMKIGDKEKCLLINPTIPIPQESTDMHGITDADVKGKPTFKALAEKLFRIFDGATLVGYNIKRFDIPMLAAEFKRCGLRWDPDGVPVIDVFEIFCHYNPRTLAAAVAHYLGEEMIDAHNALADVLATEKVFRAQEMRHFTNYTPNGTSSQSLEHISKEFNPDDLGWDGKLKMQNGKAIVNFGKHRGKSLETIARIDRGWLEWAVDNDVFCAANRRRVLEVL